MPSNKACSGAPGLVDRLFAIHAGSGGLDSHWRHMSERFFRSNRPGYPHLLFSKLENSGIRVAVGDCSVTERRRWRPPYQTCKTVHANTLQNNEDGRTTECRGIPFYLSHFVTIFSNLHPDRGVKWPFLGMLTELSRCK